MRKSAWITVMVLGVCLLAATQATAAIINGNFSQPLTVGWSVTTFINGGEGGAASAAIDENGKLHMVATTRYNWTEQGDSYKWRRFDEDLAPSSATVSQICTTDDDTGAMDFWAEAVYSVTLTGVISEDQANVSDFVQQPDPVLITNTSWAQLQMSGLASSSSSWIRIEVIAELSSDEQNDQGLFGGATSGLVTVDAYFDNFEFVVPEPSALLLLCSGAALLALKHRRRAKVSV